MNREQLAQELELDEGRKNLSYTDTVGVNTIGIGRNIDDKGLSDSEIDFMLQNDIDECSVDLMKDYPWWADIPEPWQRGLCNMRFNLGRAGLAKFKKMLAALEAGNGSEAAIEALNSKWARQVGARSERIAKLYRGY